jgi:hypothetical protein
VGASARTCDDLVVPDASSTRDVAAATLRAFAERSGAERIVLLIDQGDGRTASLLECEPGGPVLLTEGDETRALAPADATPLPLPDVRPTPAPAVRLDPDAGEVIAPFGVVARLAAAVLELARAFGGRSVATADFPTAEPDRPLTIAAREGEPVVLAMGDRHFALPAGWPGG